jgi:hypothetical protein
MQVSRDSLDDSLGARLGPEPRYRQLVRPHAEVGGARVANGGFEADDVVLEVGVLPIRAAIGRILSSRS